MVGSNVFVCVPLEHRKLTIRIYCRLITSFSHAAMVYSSSHSSDGMSRLHLNLTKFHTYVGCDDGADEHLIEIGRAHV